MPNRATRNGIQRFRSQLCPGQTVLNLFSNWPECESGDGLIVRLVRCICRQLNLPDYSAQTPFRAKFIVSANQTEQNLCGMQGEL